MTQDAGQGRVKQDTLAGSLRPEDFDGSGIQARKPGPKPTAWHRALSTKDLPPTLEGECQTQCHDSLSSALVPLPHDLIGFTSLSLSKDRPTETLARPCVLALST